MKLCDPEFRALYSLDDPESNDQYSNLKYQRFEMTKPPGQLGVSFNITSENVPPKLYMNHLDALRDAFVVNYQ